MIGSRGNRPIRLSGSIVLLFALTACAGGGGSGEGEVLEDVQSDSSIEADIREDGFTDASEWLAGEDHVLWEGSKEEARALLDELKAAGSPKIYMVGIEAMEDEGSGDEPAQKVEIAASFAVEIPAGWPARGAVLEKANRFLVEQGLDPEKDRGQKYVVLSYD